jgi:hypothetical protein
MPPHVSTTKGYILYSQSTIFQEVFNKVILEQSRTTLPFITKIGLKQEEYSKEMHAGSITVVRKTGFAPQPNLQEA